MKLALSLGAALFGLSLTGVPVTALPLDRGVASQAPIERTAGGCGRGYAPTRWGRCRPIRGYGYGHRPGFMRDARPAPMWRQNLREHAAGCAYVRTPRGMVHRCD